MDGKTLLPFLCSQLLGFQKPINRHIAMLKYYSNIPTKNGGVVSKKTCCWPGWRNNRHKGKAPVQSPCHSGQEQSRIIPHEVTTATTFKWKSRVMLHSSLLPLSSHLFSDLVATLKNAIAVPTYLIWSLLTAQEFCPCKYCYFSFPSNLSTLFSQG